MQLVHVHVSDELRTRLKAESERTGAPVAELIRRAADEYLARREEKPQARQLATTQR